MGLKKFGGRAIFFWEGGGGGIYISFFEGGARVGSKKNVGFIFAMAQIRRIGNDHQTPFWHVLLVVVVVVEVSSGDAKRKQAATCTIHLGPPIFLQILDPL